MQIQQVEKIARVFLIGCAAVVGAALVYSTKMETEMKRESNRLRKKIKEDREATEARVQRLFHW